MKIGVIQPKMIGDVLITSVVFEVLRNHFPNAELHYIINKNTLPVVENNPNINKIILLDTNNNSLLNQIKKIRKEKYSILIDSYSKLNTALMCKFSGAMTTISFHKTYSNFFYTTTIVRKKESFSIATKAIEHRLVLLEPLGIPFSLIQPKIYLKEEEIAKAKETLIQQGIDLDKPLVMISALGSSDEKTYPLHYMAEVLDVIAHNPSIQILFNYIPNQKGKALELYHLCKPTTQQQIFIDFYASSLREFMSITHHCNALIGNEGGAVNMAKTLGVPTFTIFSPFILKNDWNMFEDGKVNVSVHVSDYFSSIVQNKNSTSEQIYASFTPDLFQNALASFLIYNQLHT